MSNEEQSESISQFLKTEMMFLIRASIEENPKFRAEIKAMLERTQLNNWDEIKGISFQEVPYKENLKRFDKDSPEYKKEKKKGKKLLKRLMKMKSDWYGSLTDADEIRRQRKELYSGMFIDLSDADKIAQYRKDTEAHRIHKE